MDEGTEAEPVTPAVGEVGDVDVGIAGCLPLAPDQQSFLGRKQGRAGPKLLLEGQRRGLTIQMEVTAELTGHGRSRMGTA